jgi:hypothetical protein
MVAGALRVCRASVFKCNISSPLKRAYLLRLSQTEGVGKRRLLQEEGEGGGEAAKRRLATRRCSEAVTRPEPGDSQMNSTIALMASCWCSRNSMKTCPMSDRDRNARTDEQRSSFQ